jgi:predicted chitinase
VAIETASTFRPVREAFWLSEEWRSVNLYYYPYYGRGYIQLTHDYNYQAIGNRLGISLLATPELALEPGIAARVFADYWKTRVAGYAEQQDWLATRKAVVGWVTNPPGYDRLRQIATSLMEGHDA